MWHYRPWKPIVDGNFLPTEANENKKESLSAFLPEHPNTLMKAGRFNKVNLIIDIYLTNRYILYFKCFILIFSNDLSNI